VRLKLLELILRITSANNARLKEAARLITSSRDRRKAGKCVLEGEHLVGAFVERYGVPETLVVSDSFVSRPTVAKLIAKLGERALVVPDALFDGLAPLPAGVGVLAVVPAPREPEREPGDFCLVLDDVQDPGNVGSMIRSAAAAGVTDVVLSRHCAFAWSPKVLRAGMGGHFHVAIREDVDLVAWSKRYRERGGNVVAMVSAGGRELFDAPLRRPLAVAIGNEGAGLSAPVVEAASERVSILMPGGTESLNAAAAAAVVLFECVRRNLRGAA
jgi:TrmH family RNA methyltransferase